MDVMEQEPERRERLWENTRRVAEGLRALGFDTGASETPIIPVLIGDPFQAARFWRALFDLGVFAHPIVPPAVPANASRIRVSMSAEHSDEQIEQVLDAFARVAKKVPVSWSGKRVPQGR
jgi:8-amino-7-oxononanoate synthase